MRVLAFVRSALCALVLASALAGAPTLGEEIFLDGQGRPVRVVHDDGTETHIGYDEQGRIIFIQKPDGTQLCTTYGSDGSEVISGC